MANITNPPARWRWGIWVVYVMAWTIALIVPIPETPGLAIEGLQISLRTLIAKALHVSAYVLLAVLSGWLRIPQRFRWLLMFGIMVHATVTELIQLFVVYRSGQLTDVALDHLGIALGVACTWKWWSAADSPVTSGQPSSSSKSP